MHQLKTLLAVVVISIGTASPGCDQANEGKSKFTQKATDSLYKNAYFNFMITLPDGWYAQDNEGAKAMTEQGGQIIAGKDENLKAVIEAAEENTVNLFGFFAHPVGTPVPFNPSVGGVAENVELTPGIKEGKDYLYHVKSLMAQGALDIQFDDELSAIQIDGVDFDVLNLAMNMNGMRLQQRYHVAIYKRYAICFIMTYSDNEQFEQVSDVIESIKLNWNH